MVFSYFDSLNQATVRPIRLTLFALFICHVSIAQNYWAKRQAGQNVDETLGVVSDPEGNTYSTGYFSTSADINEENLSVNGLTDIFVSKTSLTGETLWSVSFGGPQSDRGLGITVDNSGNILVCGFFTGTVNFGNDVVLSSDGGQDAFLLKLDSDGLALWAVAVGSTSNSDRANAVAVDSTGSVAITGQFSGDASFGSFNLNASDGSIDAFIVKYDVNGNALWVKHGAAEALERGMALSFDNEGNVYAAGQFTGDITFDNLYENNMFNAIFLVKFSFDGNQEWIRSIGGTQEAIAYGMTSDGENIYLTGDFGASVSILGGGLPQTITSPYLESFFIFSFSESGTPNWTTTSGSGSLVSARAIDYLDGELAVAGFYRCTFEEYSEAYGSATFNSIGFEDAFAARYSAENGDFLWARNFGSRSDEQALGIALLPDGLEVICGAFLNKLVFPINGSVSGSHVSELGLNNMTYCDDEHYKSFFMLTGQGNQDGFLIKVLSEERAPFDYFLRDDGTACDPSILNPCIHSSNSDDLFDCPDTLSICPSYSVLFSSLVSDDDASFDHNYYWTNPNGGNSPTVTVEGEFSVLMESVDGCYSRTDDVYVIVAPDVEHAFLSDNVVVNDSVTDPELIEACIGDTVLIWASYPDSLSGQWQIWGTDIASAQDTILVTNDIAYTVEVSNAFGCSATNGINVEFDPSAEDLPVDIYFPYESDTVQVCENSFAGVAVHALVDGTSDLYPNDPYSLDWEVNLNASIGYSSDNSIGPAQSGWHVVSVTAEPNLNSCNDLMFSYSDTDSIYIELMPSPESFVTVTGPTEMCFGDTVVLYIDYSGTLTVSNLVAENFTDSVYITSADEYYFWTDTIGPNGCPGGSSVSHTVSNFSSPQLYTDPPNSVICPNDSVLIMSNTEGEFLWQGPENSVLGDNNLWATQSGLYFAEVTLENGCVLVSNTIQLAEYSTPFLFAEDGFVCQGGSEQIWVISNSIETIEWLPPLSGSDDTQIVSEAGIYSVQVTGCEITTDISIEIFSEEPEVYISLEDDLPTCEGDSILVNATFGFDTYEWSPSGEGSSQYFDSPGLVSVTASTEEGCQAISESLNLSFEPIPPPPTFVYELPCEGESMEVLIPGGFQANVMNDSEGSVVSTDSIQFISQLSTDTTIYVYLASPYCIGDTLSLDLSPMPYPAEPIAATDAPACTGTNLSLEIVNAESGVDYIWLTPNGDVLNGDLITYGISDLNQEGMYQVFAELGECITDTLGTEVMIFETVQVNLPPDTSLCYVADFSVAPDTLFASYLWSDNSTDSVFIPNEDISEPIVLTATDFNGCVSVDVMNVVFVNCLVVVPNIFTPNGDGLNDFWSIELESPQYYQATVINRSGRTVYETNSAEEDWDGTNANSGEPCPEGTYFYVVQVKDFEGRLIEDKGNLTLLRD